MSMGVMWASRAAPLEARDRSESLDCVACGTGAIRPVGCTTVARRRISNSGRGSSLRGGGEHVYHDRFPRSALARHDSHFSPAGTISQRIRVPATHSPPRRLYPGV